LLATRVRPIPPSTVARHALSSDEQLVSSIRGDDPVAFEALYERHQRELLSFCLYMLGSRADAEEALQVTFASAYRALLADERPVVLRPWLFAIARNQCLTILRRRHPTVELGGAATVTGDLFQELELREEVRHTLAGVRELPERQRAAMVLAELHGLSQAEIGSVLGLRPEQVKALVYQARSSLISERTARDADCREIREELATARGAALLKGQLRRHVRACPDCRTYADGMARRRRGFGAFIPLAPWLALKLRALQDTLSGAGTEQLTYAGGTTLGGTVAGAALVAGGPIKVIAVKVAAGAALLGLSTGLGAPVLSTPAVHHGASAAGIVARPAWLPLLGEGAGSGPPHHGAFSGGGWSGGDVPGGGLPPGGSGVPPLGGIEGGAGGGSGGSGAGGSGGGGGGGGAGASGSADGSGGHGGSGAHHVAGPSAGTLAGTGAAGASGHGGQKGGAPRHVHSGQAGGSGGTGGSAQSGGGSGPEGSGQPHENGHSGGNGGSPGEGPSSAKGTGHPHGGKGGNGGKGGGRGSAERSARKKEAERAREEAHKEHVLGRKEHEKEHRHKVREHKEGSRQRTHEKAQREAEHARTTAKHEHEREQKQKQNESRKQRAEHKRERAKEKRSKSHSVPKRGREAEAAT